MRSTAPRSVAALVLAGLALLVLFFSAWTPAHAHDDGIYNEDCQLSALATLGGSVTLVAHAPVAALTPATVATPLFSGLAASRFADGSVGSRAPPAA